MRGKLPRCGKRKRPPDPESTDDPDDWSFGLQFDIANLGRTLDPTLRDLACTRSLPSSQQGHYRAAVAVFQLKSGLHGDSGMPVFQFPKGNPRLLSREACGPLEPICPWDVVKAALHVKHQPAPTPLPSA